MNTKQGSKIVLSIIAIGFLLFSVGDARLALSQGGPPAPGRAPRRICAQIFDLDAKTMDQVQRKMKELKTSGVDTVIFRVFQNKGDRVYKCASPRHQEGVYFRTEHAPVVDDLLGKVADAAHRNGLEIFAWMTTRYANYGYDNNIEQRCRRYNFETKKIEAARGSNLFHPEVIRRLEGLFRDLGRYPIDGILLHDDLILKHNEDFSPEASRSFLKEYGTTPHPDLFYIEPYRSNSGSYYVKSYSDLFWSWAKWKNQWLMNLAKQLMDAARESNPRLKFGLNLYFEAVLNPSNSVAWFSQTLSGALEKGFDYYAVMAYHRQAMHQLGLSRDDTVARMAEAAQKAVDSVGDASRVIMKIQILDWKTYEVIPKAEVEGVLSGVLKGGEVSLAFVPYVEPFPLGQLKKTWERRH